MKHIEVALSQYGLKEIEGVDNNPEILKYFTVGGHTWVQTDETAWCSAFMNWVFKQADKPFSGQLNARSWLSVGEGVTEPKVGDVVVLWRVSPGSWKGHVGMYINSDDEWIWILGGNQSDRVCIKKYPKARLLEYRRV
jgi:uncharacterized protein (TIGR02594 family)